MGEGEDYVPVTRELDESDYRMYYDGTSPQGSVIVDIAAQMRPGSGVLTGLPILAMSYMDAWTIDLKRLKECNLGVTVADGRTIPFCAYHLTDARGQRLYPLGQRRSATIECP